MRRWLLVVAVLAACKSSSTPPPGPGSAPSRPIDAAVAETTASALPACKQKVTFDVFPTGPSGAGRLEGNELYVGSLSGRHFNLSVYDVSARTWSVLPGVDLGPNEQQTHFMQFVTKQSVLLLTESEGSDHWVAHPFDRASHRWLAPANTPSNHLSYLNHEVGDTVVWVPYRRCGFDLLDKTLVLRANKFVPAPAKLSLRARPAQQVVGNKLVVWGGEAIANPPREGDIGCKGDRTNIAPVGDGAVLDPMTATWKPTAAGPPAMTGIRSFAAADYMFVYGVAGTKPVLWRYDVGKDAWKELTDVPKVYAVHAEEGDFLGPSLDVATVGSRVVMNHGDSAPVQDVIDVEAGTLRAGATLPVEPSAFVAIDKTHVIAIPRLPVPAKATAYIEDLDTLTWCELPWIDRAPFYGKRLPGIAVAKSVGDKLYVWLDGAAGGYVATFH